MYIVKQNVNGKDYFYIRKSIRKKDKIISENVAYGGKTRVEAEKKLNDLKNKSNKDEKLFEESEKESPSKNEINKELSIEKLAKFCKAKGFIFPSSEIYGGIAGFWDFGPLGVELLNNIKKAWWNFFVEQRENIVGIEASIISHPRTWKASGHLKNFNDVSVICKKCGRVDKIDKNEIGKIFCDSCGGEYELKGEFNLMFKTSIGALNPIEGYLRGETAQGMFLNFKNIVQTSRLQLPFGIAQLGRCFRNEIAPRDFLFRSREFHIAEFEFFIHPEEKKCGILDESHLNLKIKFLDEETQKNGKDELKEVTIDDILKKGKLDEWHAYWLSEQIRWFYSINLKEIKIREHKKDELSHYSSATFDIDYEYPFGSKEIAGNANRGQFDLKEHEKESNESMEIFDEKTKKRVIPKVIEPTFGIERVFLAILTKAYNYDNERNNIVLKIPANLAPIKAAVFPIIKKGEYEEISEKIVNNLRKKFNINYDVSGSIGRRYARNDEIGTPMCITIDEKTPKDKSVTIRDRDTTKQIRVKIKELEDIIQKVIDGENILNFGKVIDTRKKQEKT
ncbi:MAG: glycine--tRNA ligase [Candidatus Pacearchaeota archaeon]